MGGGVFRSLEEMTSERTAGPRASDVRLWNLGEMSSLGVGLLTFIPWLRFQTHSLPHAPL